jgi:replicative DNA helicase
MNNALPNAQNLEQSLLGSLLVYPQVMALCQVLDLSPEEFYLPGHQKIFSAMADVQAQGKPIDLNNVTLRLQERQELESAGGLDYLIALLDGAVSGVSARSYITTIKDKAMLRRLIESAEAIRQDAMESSEGMDDILQNAERQIMNVTRDRRGTDFQSSAQIVTRVLDEIKILRTTQGITGIKTGYTDLDKMTNGFQRGDLVILAARPAMGKSALALNFVTQTARRNEGAVALFSLEMPADSLVKRMLSSESKVYSNKLRDGRLTNEEMNRLYEAGNQLSQSPIYIDDTSSIKVSQIFSKCRKLHSEAGSLSLVVIDYLQLISGSARSDSRQQEVSEISRNLKILAKEMNCPVIALSQLSRKVEERTNHEPQLSDLRESGSIEQDADIVMFLYRENYYDSDKEGKDEMEVVDLSLAKHRNGAIGKVQLAFEKSVSRFTNYASASSDDIYAG